MNESYGFCPSMKILFYFELNLSYLFLYPVCQMTGKYIQIIYFDAAVDLLQSSHLLKQLKQDRIRQIKKPWFYEVYLNIYFLFLNFTCSLLKHIFLICIKVCDDLVTFNMYNFMYLHCFEFYFLINPPGQLEQVRVMKTQQPVEKTNFLSKNMKMNE